MLDLADAQRMWAPSCPYLNTASYGLPPRPAWEALQAALEDWRGGRTSWEHWGEATERSRELWARMAGVAPEQVAVAANVSSLVWPFVARGLEVRTVPLRDLADGVDAETDVVAFSAVQSANGEVADLDGVAAAAAEHGALTVCDATHAFGWMPLDASRFDAVAAHAYKWLMSPRGTAFLALGDRLADRVPPLAANWYAAADPRGGYYGLPMRLASSARRLDLSPAWFSWVGTAPALEVVLEIGVEAIRRHNLALANRFRAGLGLEPSDSAIVSAEILGAAEKLERAGIRAATRAGSLRASFHVYNTEADVDAALAALLD